ncbi:MAG: hypothetical protein D6741_05240, partial [Planctomycetota bacterium]
MNRCRFFDGWVVRCALACVGPAVLMAAAFAHRADAGEFGLMANSVEIRKLPPEEVAAMMQRHGYKTVFLSCSA